MEKVDINMINEKEKEDLNVISPKENNIIWIIIKIDKENINRKIYFLDYTDGIFNENGKEFDHHHYNIKELNKFNTELFINNMKYKYEKYFIPKKQVYMKYN